MIREGFKGRAKLFASHDSAGSGACEEERGGSVRMGEQRTNGSGTLRAGSARFVVCATEKKAAPRKLCATADHRKIRNLCRDEPRACGTRPRPARALFSWHCRGTGLVRDGFFSAQAGVGADLQLGEFFFACQVAFTEQRAEDRAEESQRNAQDAGIFQRENRGVLDYVTRGSRDGRRV